ncbi:SAM-dependent methyltransferase, MidA family [Roseovarius marisflavi]|uniref:SAM-dependent methyltransferase, MidA family n=1 Tax=Roseovarius marisflavi TaxID=1054996 RepID=A0A1M7A4B5_9RHOB|nr:SAM-dependent methyltransferase [Roseovarius marisflavi]SHL37554.1 SAM-dependent methyltransferase, MidA family [Roseovarius marisflavi]
MSRLRDHLIARISEGGPITLADYMATCLMHPEHGYYATRDPFGAGGDFITAPEISQMFGELIGLCLAQCWLDQGAPARIALAEAGPGRGTLMADILRATKGVPGFHDAAQLHLIETSPTLRDIQSKTIARPDITFHERADTLPSLPLYLVANEFFDALPICQFERDGDGWRERLIGLKEGQLAVGLGGPAALPQLAHRLADTKPGDVVETCAPAEASIAVIGARIDAHGGAALVIDYGDWRSLGDTFQALEGHAATDPLANPGNADLTAHVDFEALAKSAVPAAHTRLTPQGVFLERLGITQRAQALARNLQGEALENHIAAHRRLTHATEMGTLFKVLGLFPKSASPPPGLET